MRVAWVAIGVTLVLACGCAQQDWIDRTLVTVDVTGVWQGGMVGAGPGGTNYVRDVELVLRQEGSRVKGDIRGLGTGSGTIIPGPIPIEGTVSGDKFSFQAIRGQSLSADLQVNGDEMIGSGGGLNTFKISLRRRPQ